MILPSAVRRRDLVFGLGFDFLQGGLEQVTLFLADPALERPGIQERDQDGQAGKAKADQPVSDKRQIPQPPLQAPSRRK